MKPEGYGVPLTRLFKSVRNVKQLIQGALVSFFWHSVWHFLSSAQKVPSTRFRCQSPETPDSSRYGLQLVHSHTQHWCLRGRSRSLRHIHQPRHLRSSGSRTWRTRFFQTSLCSCCCVGYFFWDRSSWNSSCRECRGLPNTCSRWSIRPRRKPPSSP